MTAADVSDPGSESWIVEAGRELDPPRSDIERLTTTVIDSARRLSHSRTELATDGTAVIVTDRVVRRVLMMEIRRRLERPVLEVTVSSEEGIVTGVHLGLMCRYDDALGALAQRAREITTEVLTATIGPDRGRAAAERIDVDWMDLEWSAPGRTEN